MSEVCGGSAIAIPAQEAAWRDCKLIFRSKLPLPGQCVSTYSHEVWLVSTTHENPCNFLVSVLATATDKEVPGLRRSAHPLLILAQVCSPTTLVEAAAAQF